MVYMKKTFLFNLFSCSQTLISHFFSIKVADVDWCKTEIVIIKRKLYLLCSASNFAVLLTSSGKIAKGSASHRLVRLNCLLLCCTLVKFINYFRTFCLCLFFLFHVTCTEIKKKNNCRLFKFQPAGWQLFLNHCTVQASFKNVEHSIPWKQAVSLNSLGMVKFWLMCLQNSKNPLNYVQWHDKLLTRLQWKC